MFEINKDVNHVIIEDEPFIYDGYEPGSRGNWRASWIDHPERPKNDPSAALFSLKFTVEKDSVIRIHVSADNRYKLIYGLLPVNI